MKDQSTMSYQIRIKGYLDERWLRQFEGLTLSQTPTGDTILQGEMDQAALYGILSRIRDLGMELISLQSSPLNNQNQERKTS